MPRKRKRTNDQGDRARGTGQPISLKELAAHVGLSPTSLSLVLNGSPGASALPQETKTRIFAAADVFKYPTNFLACSFGAQHTYTLGVMVPELRDRYSAIPF